MDLQIQPYGERAILVEAAEDCIRFGLVGALEDSPPDGFVEYVLGHSNLLVIFNCAECAERFSVWIAGRTLINKGESAGSRLIEVPVYYDGADLRAIAQQVQLTEREVVARHCAPVYQVRMIGFSPGFPYLDGLDPKLHIDRRGSPRTHIPPGSIAIGGPHAGIYTVASPGGWHFLGRTDLPLFNPDQAKGKGVSAASVFLLKPGDRVKFVEAAL